MARSGNDSTPSLPSIIERATEALGYERTSEKIEQLKARVDLLNQGIKKTFMTILKIVVMLLGVSGSASLASVAPWLIPAVLVASALLPRPDITSLSRPLEDVNRNQRRVLALEHASIRVLDDKLHEVVASIRELEQMNRMEIDGIDIDPDGAAIRDLKGRLDNFAETIVRELHKRVNAADEAKRIFEESERLRQDQRGENESWISWLWGLFSLCLFVLLGIIIIII
jgi:hypothetical protein